MKNLTKHLFKKQAIGIIGGMGPEASEKFYGLLIKYAQEIYGVGNNDDFPEIYLASIPVPDFIADQNRMDKALKMLVDRIRKLDLLPVGFYCLACNTGHLLIDKLRESTDNPFVSLLDEVPKYLKQQAIKRVGLLATPTTIKSQMYHSGLKKAGIELIIPEEEDINLLGVIIKETIACENKPENSLKIQQIADHLADKGAGGILEACTEIPIIFPKQYKVPVYDTLEILAKEVLKRYYETK